MTGGENETDSASLQSPELEGLGGAVFDNDDPNTLSRPESVAINYFVIMLLYSKHLKTIITGKTESFGRHYQTTATRSEHNTQDRLRALKKCSNWLRLRGP